MEAGTEKMVKWNRVHDSLLVLSILEIEWYQGSILQVLFLQKHNLHFALDVDKIKRNDQRKRS